MYQVPALKGAGYEVITFDNRGVPPSDVPPGDYSLADLVAGTAGLIEALDAGPGRLVGTSLGALVATERAVSRPDLVSCCVLMAVRARSDAARWALSAGESALAGGGIHGQNAIDLTSDRRGALQAVSVPCRVIAFSDDLICPPHLGADHRIYGKELV